MSEEPSKPKKPFRVPSGWGRPREETAQETILGGGVVSGANPSPAARPGANQRETCDVRKGELRKLRAAFRETLEDIIRDGCRNRGLPDPTFELPFCPVRKWRFDFCWPALKIAVEIDGGGWVHGRHHRPLGARRDNEKINHAQALGWRVFRFDRQQIDSGEAFTWLARKSPSWPG